jgi:hypothetical protein
MASLGLSSRRALIPPKTPSPTPRNRVAEISLQAYIKNGHTQRVLINPGVTPPPWGPFPLPELLT